MKNVSFLFKLSLLAMAAGGVTVANAVDIATAPLWSSTMADVKPNVLFVLDDSGSMASDFLPDDVGSWRANDFPYCVGPACGFAYGQFGRRSPQCNGVAFDPTKTYALPVNADGTTKPDATDANLRSMFAPLGAAGTTVAPAVATLVSSSSAITSGKLTLKVSAPPAGVSYFPSQVVTMYDASLSSRYSSGIVDSVSVDSKGVRTIVINVVYGAGDGASIASGNARLALGTPNGALIYTYSGSQPKLNFEYTSSSVVTTSTFYTECGYGYDSVEGQKVFKPLILSMNYAPSGDSEDAKAKDKAVLVAYWRWFKYYRTRMLTMQSAVSLAFKPLDDRYRVGFTTILSKSVTSGMLDVADFNATQKADFYKSLYASVPDKSTPLRGAVMKAGRYFAKQMPGQTYDPIQYSCQRNYLILSTDGYWNTWDEDSASYTALNVTGSALVGHQDSGLKRPYNDGGSETTKVTTTWTRTNTFKRTTETPIKADYRRDVTATTISKTYATGTGSCKSGLPWLESTTRTVDTDTYTKSRSKRTDTYDVTQVRYYTQVTTTVNGSATVGGETFTDGAEKLVRSGETVWEESAETKTSSRTGPTTTTAKVCAPSRPADVPPTTTPGDTGWLLVPPSSETTPYPAGSVAKVTDGAVTSNLSTKVPVTEFTRTGGTPDTLADLAYYYYKTDLRSPELKNCTGAMGVDVCENNVPAGGLEDWATHQHMVFYGLSLGAGNSLKYDKNYMTAASGDFYNIKNGLPATSPKEWPTPEANTVTAVDDLWHAAVNGRGLYFSAMNPESLSDGLASALRDITKVSGTAAAAATSTLQPIKGENGLYMAQFTSPDWVGDLKKYEFDATGKVVTVVYDDAGKVVKDAFVWSAAAKL
ncbi:MAG TPA: hypothetical protein VK195_08760, partial [Burkholderiaceae bacterium]|nr:hypothetical protein [Burkholderiaceae bacterium]